MAGIFKAGEFTGPHNVHRGPRTKVRKRTCIRELAEFFDVAPKTIYRRIRRSPTPLNLFDIQSVFQFIAQQTVVMSMVKR